MADALTPPIPAATVILYREAETGPAQHLLIERTAKMAFAAGALVFPGGRIDAGDRAAAAEPAIFTNPPHDADDTAARIAAVREAIEEVGIAIGISPTPSVELVVQWRAALKAGGAIGPLLAAAGARIDLSKLVLVARWCPNLGEIRRFDTRFYIARLDGAAEVEVDADEATRHCWLTAQDAINIADAGGHRIIYPTMRNLERLAKYPRFDAMLAHLELVPIQTITPWIGERFGVPWLCIPEDAGYPVTGVPMSELVGP